MTGKILERRPSELLVRTGVGAALIVVAVLGLWFGGLLFWLLMTLVGLAMMSEWGGLVGASAKQKRLAIFTLFVVLACLSPLTWGPDFFTLGLLAGGFFFVVIVTSNPWLAAGVAYVGLPVLSLLLIRRQIDVGIVYTLWTLALVWMTDIGAYFAGRAIGGPKLAPKLSPKKTWAGLIGGVILSSLFAAWMHWAYGLAMRLTLATPVLAVVAQGGDLFESWLKRRAGAKDSGDLLPGHGGFLDRLDGLVPVAPIAAFLVVAVPKLYGLWLA